jgi:rhodanese-related sulfurtransferase
MKDSNRDIDVETLGRMRVDEVPHVLLDIREPDEIAICAIEDSLVIPMQQIPQSLETLPRDRPLVVLCHHGMRSAMVADFLRSNGFDNAKNLAGGIDAWARLMDPDMRRY